MAATDFLRSEAELVLTEVRGSFVVWTLQSNRTPRKARRIKSEKIKNLGSPIQLPGKPLAIQVRDGFVWAAESTHVAKKIDLEVCIDY